VMTMFRTKPSKRLATKPSMTTIEARASFR
jgi:hypothetical protein